MSTVVLQNLAQFLLFAVTAVFIENAVFTRGFGVSRLVNLVENTAVDNVIFFAFLCLIQVVSAPLSYFANVWLTEQGLWYASYIRPLMFAVCAVVAFLLVVGVIYIVQPPNRNELLSVLPLASFNCAVLGPLLISATQHLGFVETVGFALGSGLGYGLAILMLSEAQHKLQNENVPASLRGLPINLVYIGILALAIYGLTGHRLAI